MAETTLQHAALESTGMSESTFYGLAEELKEIPGVTFTPKGKRWSYSNPDAKPGLDCFFLEFQGENCHKGTVVSVKPYCQPWQSLRVALLLWGALLCASEGLGQQWASTTPLPSAFQEHVLVYANGFLYNIGGVSSSNGELDGTNVFYSQVHSNGTIGPWNHTTSLPESTFDSAGVADRDFIYATGGFHYNSTLGDFVANTVYYAKINPDGTLGVWQTATPLPQSVFWHSAGIWNHVLYTVGGCGTNGNPISNVYSAKIQLDGSLSPWIERGALPESRCAHSQAINGRLYVLAGTGNVNLTNGVYYTKINSDASLGSWNFTTAYPQKVVNGGAVAGAGWILGVGGWNGMRPINAVYAAQVSGDGSLGSWETGTSLPQPLLYFGVTANDSYIFLSGGEGSVQTSAAVYSIPLPPAPPAPILTAQRTNQIQLRSSINTGFGIQASTNLINWTNIGWGLTDTNGTLIFQDTNAPSFPSRFYRAYWPLP